MLLGSRVSEGRHDTCIPTTHAYKADQEILMKVLVNSLLGFQHYVTVINAGFQPM